VQNVSFFSASASELSLEEEAAEELDSTVAESAEESDESSEEQPASRSGVTARGRRTVRNL
jgi:hypothetical protein